jgi:hypothetical protein
MSVELPAPIAGYIAAETAGETEGLGQFFADSAVVLDEGRTIKGLAAIKQWKAETKRKYHHTVAPLRSVQKDDTTTVTCRLTGDFPGSPVDLDFTFRVENDKITSLEIR